MKAVNDKLNINRRTLNGVPRDSLEVIEGDEARRYQIIKLLNIII